MIINLLLDDQKCKSPVFRHNSRFGMELIREIIIRFALPIKDSLKIKQILTLAKRKRKSWATPGSSLSIEEFKGGIKKAEEGSFHSIEESQSIVKEWRKKRSSR